MDAFENLVATLLRRDGYWTSTAVKVELTKEEKLEIVACVPTSYQSRQLIIAHGLPLRMPPR